MTMKHLLHEHPYTAGYITVVVALFFVLWFSVG